MNKTNLGFIPYLYLYIYAIILHLLINHHIFKPVWLSEVEHVIYVFDSGH